LLGPIASYATARIERMFRLLPVAGNLKADVARLEVIVVFLAAKIDEPIALIVSLIARLITKRGNVGAIVTLVPAVCEARVVPKYALP
jgi:hypothetical protein